MQNSMGMFTFSVFNTKHFFWANLIQKIKIVNLTWNLVPKLIQKCRIQWECSLFLFSMGNTFFWANSVQKIQIVNLIWNLVLALIQIYRIQCWCSLFLFSSESTLFGQIWSQNSKLTVQSKIWYLDQLEYLQLNGDVYVFDRKYPLWANLVQKIKIFSLS